MYKRITASGDLSMPQGTRICGVRLESTSDDCSAILYDDTTQALGATNSRQVCTLFVTTHGTDDIHPNSDKQDFGEVGIALERGLSVTLSGTTPKLYIYYA